MGGDFKGHDHGRFAGKDFDHNHNFDHHHGRHFGRFGPDIFVYGGGDYGYGDCGWLRRQAVITGSPYWWRRYQDCLYYE